ncbi:MAG: SWIM zinc finger family protein [Planctomyces sp.]|nr:SWIM zinc finger family protein [Planctomyces sp.]
MDVQEFSCTCPYFEGTGLCKHLWATLRYIDLNLAQATRSQSSDARSSQANGPSEKPSSRATPKRTSTDQPSSNRSPSKAKERSRAMEIPPVSVPEWSRN